MSFLLGCLWCIVRLGCVDMLLCDCFFSMVERCVILMVVIVFGVM